MLDIGDHHEQQEGLPVKLDFERLMLVTLLDYNENALEYLRKNFYKYA